MSLKPGTSQQCRALVCHTTLFLRHIFVTRGFRLCGGEQRALRSPSAILRSASLSSFRIRSSMMLICLSYCSRLIRLLCQGRGFAPAGAIKELCGHCRSAFGKLAAGKASAFGNLRGHAPDKMLFMRHGITASASWQRPAQRDAVHPAGRFPAPYGPLRPPGYAAYPRA